MALAIAVSAANPFYAQSLLPLVRQTLGLPRGMVLLGPIATQLGIALGYVLLVPLGDSRDRRRLLSVLALAMALASGAAADCVGGPDA